MTALGHEPESRHVRVRIAVGTRVTSRPPHRSVLAQFRHTAPASGMKRRFAIFSRRAVCAPAPVTRAPGTVPGACFAGSHSPRPPPLAPPAPQRIAPPCPAASQLLGGGLPPPVRASSAPAPRLPDAAQISNVPVVGRGVSRFPRKELPHMPVSSTTPGRLGARGIGPIRVAFRQQKDVGTRDEGTFAAQWLAYALPCQRFADALAGSRA